ncbi:hypothetical protein [Mesotoga sp. BH458_6_3_2_1]|uniref:hypothetical protein n=1 Tax=Mesotoga sp. BH458_6_3_2_1 TaxID=1437446 RepID=UPI000EF20DCC|nr:hypothetical protein [Mesotoga sp. BH458_6_3_2_1]RLL83075.1 hypothetical protein Y697_00865 [Mesotoga sp. BH458_6_3_2_1]
MLVSKGAIFPTCCTKEKIAFTKIVDLTSILIELEDFEILGGRRSAARYEEPSFVVVAERRPVLRKSIVESLLSSREGEARWREEE